MTPWDPATGLTGGLAAQAWQAAMLGLWNAGLWLLGLVLHLEDALLTPDLGGDGPVGEAYGLTLWMAAALGGLMLLAQLLVGLLRREARDLGAALLGCAKFVVVWAGWIGWAAAVVGAAGGLTRAVLRSLLHVTSFAGWQPTLRISPEQAVSVTVATVLGLLGMVLWLAALGHLLVMLGRAVTLLVLAATTPIAAAGLVGELGRGWFWRSVRWFHAAALTPLLMALLLGVGVQTTTGVTDGLSDGTARAVGAALPGVLLILTSCFAPLALFRLLAFVDPATPSGASFHQAVVAALQAGQLLAAPGRWSSAVDRQASQSTNEQPDPLSEDVDSSSGRRGAAEQGLQTSTHSADLSQPAAAAAPAASSAAVAPANDASVGGAAPAAAPSATSDTGSATLVGPAGPDGADVDRSTSVPARGGDAQRESDGRAPGRPSAAAGPASGSAGDAALVGEAGALPVVPL